MATRMFYPRSHFKFMLLIFTWLHTVPFSSTVAIDTLYLSPALFGVSIFADVSPLATIRCTAKHPEKFEADLSKWKQAILTIFHYSWILIIFILLNTDVIIRGGGVKLFTTWKGWLVFISIFALIAVSLFRFTLFTYNNKDK